MHELPNQDQARKSRCRTVTAMVLRTLSSGCGSRLAKSIGVIEGGPVLLVDDAAAALSRAAGRSGATDGPGVLADLQRDLSVLPQLRTSRC